MMITNDSMLKRCDEQNKILKNGLAAINENLTSIAKSLKNLEEELHPKVILPTYDPGPEPMYVVDDGK